MSKKTATQKKRGTVIARGDTKESNKKVTKGKRVKTFSEEPAFVSYRNGATINLGNYQSARLEIGITMPCHVKNVKKTLKDLIIEVNEEVDELARTYEVPAIDMGR